MLLGGILLVGGAFGYLLSSNDIAAYQTPLGQLGRALSDEEQTRYQQYQTIQYIAVAGGVAGIALLIYGAAAKDSSRQSTLQSSGNQQFVSATPAPSGKIFCRYCGKLRPLAGTNCSECGKPTMSSVTATKGCSYCTAAVSADSEFCANCGRRFQDST